MIWRIVEVEEGRRVTYPTCLRAEADNTLRDLHNSSDHKKAWFINCFIIHSAISDVNKNLPSSIYVKFPSSYYLPAPR